MASTINSALTPVLDTSGNIIPAAVNPATVADPTQTLITVAMNQANSNGEIVDQLSILAM